MYQPRRVTRARSRSPHRTSQPAPPQRPPPKRVPSQTRTLPAGKEAAAAVPFSALRRTQTAVAVPGAALVEVLGPHGQTLKDLCRETGALVTLCPDMDCEEDGYIADIAGTQAAVAEAEDRLHELLAAAEDAAEQEEQPLGRAGQLDAEAQGGGRLQGQQRVATRKPPAFLPTKRAKTEGALPEEEAQGAAEADGGAEADGVEADADAELEPVQEDVELPRYKYDIVLGMKVPGGRLTHRKEALNEFRERFGLVQIRTLAACRSPPDTMVFQVTGPAPAVESFKEDIAQRIARCEDIVQELLPVDWSAAGQTHLVLHDELGDEKRRIERECNVYLSVQQPEIDEEQRQAQLGKNSTPPGTYTHKGYTPESGDAFTKYRCGWRSHTGQEAICIRGTLEEIEQARPMVIDMLETAPVRGKEELEKSAQNRQIKQQKKLRKREWAEKEQWKEPGREWAGKKQWNEPPWRS